MVISLTRNMLKVRIRLVNVQTLMEVSRSVDLNITAKELVTNVICTKKIISQIRLSLLLLNQIDEVVM